MKQTKLLCLVIFFLFLSTAYANAIVPVLFFYSSFLLIPSLILFVLIVLIESALLKLSIRKVKFSKHLLFSFLFNLMSSLIGSLLGFINYSIVLSDIYWSSFLVTLGVPLIVTLLAEYPAIRYLYRTHLSAKKCLYTVVKINIISYVAFCFLMTPLYLTGISKRAEYLDQKRLDEWSHDELLKGEYGSIYKINLVDKHHTIYCYSLKEKTWEEVYKVDKRECDVGIWDISSSYFVYTDLKEPGKIQIADNGSYGNDQLFVQVNGCKEIKISPSQEYIAVLEKTGEVIVQKKIDSWFQTLGNRCRLLIYDIRTGHVVCEYERPVLSSNISWSPDSKSILFETLKNDEVLLSTDFEKTNESIRLKEFIPRVIGRLDIEENNYEILCEGRSPQWNPKSSEVIFVSNSDLNFLDLSDMNITSFPEKETSRYYWSPSGKRLIGLIRTQNPIWTNKYFLTVLDRNDLSKKNIIDTDNKYDFIWIGP